MEPNATRRPPSVVPYLIYDDAPAAIAFLCDAFGFEERFRYPMPDGRVGHAELALDDGLVMLASAYPELGFAGPQHFDARHAQVVCHVDDVDRHHARAVAAGAIVAGEPRDEHGARVYRAADPEGQRWIFSSPARDAEPSSG